MQQKERIIEARETPLSDIFSERFIFSVPLFQRPLSWNESNFEQLVEDLIDSMTLEEGHFLGSIILQHKEKNLYDIIDGQQRIASLTILLAVVRDISNNPELKEHIQSYIYQKKDPFKGLPETMRFTPWDELKDIFRRYIYKPNGTQEFLRDFKAGKIKYKDEDDPIYHLWEAINIFTKKLRNIKSLEEFITHLLQNVYVVCIKTRTLTTAYRLFNVLNTRGLPLTPADLLKSENLGAIEDDKEREIYSKKWISMESRIGREELANVISYIRMIKKKEKAKLGIYEEYQQLFKSGKLVKGKQFIDYVEAIVDIYDQKVLNPDVNVRDMEKRNLYKNLVHLMYEYLPFSDWIPPLLAFYHKFEDDEYLVEFLLKLEKKFVTEWIAGFTPSARITSAGNLIKLIEEEQTPKRVLDKMLGEQYYTFKDYGYKDEKELLRDKLDDRNFYRLRGGKLAKYILLRIDMDLWELENFPGYPGKITVEHILPQNPPANSEWVRIFTKEEREEWTNKLGNLVLLSGRKNSRAQNFDFEKKKKEYFGKKWTPFRITQELRDIDTWNMDALISRHKRLIERCISIYSRV